LSKVKNCGRTNGLLYARMVLKSVSVSSTVTRYHPSTGVPGPTAYREKDDAAIVSVNATVRTRVDVDVSTVVFVARICVEIVVVKVLVIVIGAWEQVNWVWLGSRGSLLPRPQSLSLWREGKHHSKSRH